MKKIVFAGLILCSTLLSCGQQINLGKVLDGVLSQGSLGPNEIAAGLREALSVGVNIGADNASQIDGFMKNSKIKIPFPPEVQQIENTLRKVGLGSEVDKFVLSLNRGAEDAAKEAKPIFIAAIKQMTITDALSILKGDKDAATQYLKKTTSLQLAEAFSPVVEKALAKNNATKYYTDLSTAYNRIPLVKKVNTDLKAYATEKAMDGLFLLVADEEAKIRENPMARTTDLLKRVFGAQ